MTKAPCRRRNGAAPPRAEKFGDLIKEDRKVLNEEGESRDNPPVRSRGTKSCHSMDLILSVQNKDFTGDGKEFKKVSRAVAQTESCIHRQLDGIRESM